jgi:hypothetical protein
MVVFPDSDLDETKTKQILIAELAYKSHNKKWIESAINPQNVKKEKKRKEKSFFVFLEGNAQPLHTKFKNHRGNISPIKGTYLVFKKTMGGGYCR